MATLPHATWDILNGVLTLTVLSLVFRWLWKSTSVEKAAIEPGRKIFPPTQAIRILASLVAIVFAVLVVVSSYSIHKPEERWVPYVFLALLGLAPFMIPPVLTIDVPGLESRTWFGTETKIFWEEIASLHYNEGNKQFTVRSRDGLKISHGGFNVDGPTFLAEIRERTRLPLKIARPGIWKTKTVELPYHDPYQEDGPESE